MFGVDHVRHGNDHDAIERAVLVLEACVDGIEALRLVVHEVAFRLPAHEVLQGLEDRGVNLELVVLELLLDLFVEHVGEAPRDRHFDAGITLLEDFRLRLPRCGRPPDIKHEGAFGPSPGLELQLCAGG